MTSPAFDFDSVSLEWLRAKPGAKWRRTPGALAAWVADMDFAPPPVVVDALQRAATGGDLGYPDWRHITGGSPGDGVVVHPPASPPFLHSVHDSGREVLAVPAARSADSPTGWAFDHDALDAQLNSTPAKVLLLCHPHNPTGHMFSEAELRSLAAIAERHRLLIISDEIHADLTYAPAVHLPIALFAPQRTVTIHAASKAFNLAGLRYAIMHIGAAEVRSAIAQVPGHLFGAANLMGAVAAEAAWREGDEW